MASVALAKRILNRLGIYWSHTEGPELPPSHGVSAAVRAGGPALAGLVTRDLVEAVRGALPTGFRITLNGDGSHEIETPGHWTLQTPLPAPDDEDQPFDVAVLLRVQGIQDFVRESTGQPWPTPEAEPYARCNADRVTAGFADGSGEPVLRLVDRQVD